MGFQSVRFYGFRNLDDCTIQLNAHDIHFVGNNGQGKTNILESLYLLSYGSSFRTRHDRDLITWGRREMALSASTDRPEEPDGSLGISIKNGIKSIQLHGKTVRDRKILLQRAPTIVFVYEDFLLSGGSPEKRRWFMDQTLSLHDSCYVDQMRRYKKTLKERNYLLKNRNRGLLNHYTEQLVSAGLAVVEQRDSLTKEFSDVFSILYRKVSNLDVPVTLTYVPSWGRNPTSETVSTVLKEKLELDLAQGTTSVGPQRDRFVFMAEGRDFSTGASTGQRRLLSLVLRVAQARLFFEKTGQKPILLLDDVLLELDPNSRRRFRDNLPEAEQIFYTFLPGNEMNRSGDDSLTYEVKNGGLHEQ